VSERRVYWKEEAEGQELMMIVEKSPTDFKTRINNILFKPFIMLVQEPMLLAVTLYMSFVYGVVYLLFEAFPFVFVMVSIQSAQTHCNGHDR
jgi:hypothetical protein